MRGVGISLLCFACNNGGLAATPPAPAPREAASVSASSSAARDEGPIRMEQLKSDEGPAMFVMRGGPRGPGRLVFLHGMCGHGLGYAQSFQFSAARVGTLIAPQGDVSCGGVWSKWSGDVTELDRRIVAAFRALGHAEPIDDVLVAGMSQGATRAVDLVRRFPERYTRLIAMAAPTSIAAGQLKGLRGAVMMAGERDRRDLMRQSERALQYAGVPVKFLLIPEATHGAMGPTPERTMGEAFDFLRASSKPSPSAADAH